MVTWAAISIPPLMLASSPSFPKYANTCQYRISSLRKMSEREGFVSVVKIWIMEHTQCTTNWLWSFIQRVSFLKVKDSDIEVQMPPWTIKSLLIENSCQSLSRPKELRMVLDFSRRDQCVQKVRDEREIPSQLLTFFIGFFAGSKKTIGDVERSDSQQGKRRRTKISATLKTALDPRLLRNSHGVKSTTSFALFHIHFLSSKKSWRK